jgi:hypothetical protein
MKRFLSATVIAFSTCFQATSSLADPLVEPGTCELIIASRPTLEEAKQVVSGVTDKRFVKIFQAQNGWYAISIGALRPDEEEPIMTKWKASGKIPQDAYCSTGKKYVARVDSDSMGVSTTVTSNGGSGSKIWHGVGIQNTGSSWSMEVDLSGKYIEATYPENGCVAHWDYLGEKNYIQYFRERVIYEEKSPGCADGYVSIRPLGHDENLFSFSFEQGGAVVARAVLRPGHIRDSEIAELTELTRRSVSTDFPLSEGTSGRGLTDAEARDGALAIIGLSAALLGAGVDAIIPDGATYDPDLVCEDGETCWSIIKSEGRSVRIMCEQGSIRGSERCVMSNDEGRWAGGCGISDSFAFHETSMEDAAEFACGL